MGRTLLFIEKIAIFAIAVIIAAGMLVYLKVWSHDWVGYFFRAGKWYELLIVLFFGFLATKFIEYLLKWQAQTLDRNGTRQWKKHTPRFIAKK